MFQDDEHVPPINSKGRVFGGKVTNNFFLYCTSKKKLLMAFLTKTFSFGARPEFNFRSPRSLKKRPLRFPIFSGKRPNSTTLFNAKAFCGQKKSERRKKNL